MNLLKLLLFIAFFYGVQSKNNNLKKLTESMGQEVIEIGAPAKYLPEGLEEEPRGEEFSDEETITTTSGATKKETKRTTTTAPPVQTTNIEQLSQEEDETRIEKELAEIYKDTDYKSAPSEVLDEVTVATTKSTVKEALRNRNRANFKFQPDTTNKADIEKFKTSIDEINCNLRVTQRLSSKDNNKGNKLGMDHFIFGLAISLLCF